jgi:hypothetical protein
MGLSDLGSKGPGSGMMRGARRRAYVIFLMVEVFAAIMYLVACSVTLESGIHGEYEGAHPLPTATATTGQSELGGG